MEFLTLPRTIDIDEIGNRHLLYKEYLSLNKSKLNKTISEIMDSEWYFDWSNHKCPHDSWLREFNIKCSGGNIKINILLLGAFHDLFIRYSYDKVKSYEINFSGRSSELEWDIDEFIIDPNGFNVHSIRFVNGVKWKISFEGQFKVEFDQIDSLDT